MSSIECHILDTGYCLAHESVMIRGGRHTLVDCHALVALLRHPQHGWGLWDTGYAPRMVALTRTWPWRAYGLATPLRTQPEQAAVAQLAQFGLAAADIKWIVLSHLHADHIAGVLDFPQAELIVARAAYAGVAHLTGLRALRRAFIPDLLPNDFAARARFISDFPDLPLPALGGTYDLFGDGLLRLVDLPGHARGQLGMLVATAERQLLLAADGAWMRRAYRERRMPSPITRLIVDDWAAVGTTLEQLHDFALARPEVTIIPTHCPEAFDEEVRR